MKKLLDITDRKTRLLQQAMMVGCGVLVGLAITMLLDPAAELPRAVPIAILGSSLVLLVVTAGIRQRWEIEYKGHRVRFENSPITAERLFLDEGLVDLTPRLVPCLISVTRC